ncbi:Acyl-protein thioesterase [Lachnellula hyalina]|uniref:Acyl-protein thioesterase n=1 Tax=Lachnellula hyalina TaxID=1316788 RepID=A0A8H8R0N9_9HELO|nr:Acyl-protein thioesterase [Lachnellula hyalina]TVY25260.1 Acyl-protein thioesterase [Lachnellula hyalina]
MDVPLITISPSAPHTHTVVFLHGRGDTAKNFASSLQYSTDSHNRTLPEIFPSFRWVFPQAEIRQCVAFPGDKISQWFDIWNVSNFSDHEELQATGLKESVTNIRRILPSEATVLGGQWDHLVLAGISQGAATSVHTLLNLSLPPLVDGQQVSRRLGAFLGFSCRMPFPGRSLVETRKVLALEGVTADDEVIRNTPVLLEHCIDDPLVLVGNGRVLRDTLRGFGAQVMWKEYPNGGHWFNSPVGIDDAAEFLNNYVIKKVGAGTSLPSETHALPESMDLS